MTFTSKRKLKQKIQNLKELIEIQSIVVEATLSIVKDLTQELKEQDELEARMNDFDKSLKKTRYDDDMRNKEYKKKPTTCSREGDVYIETRWL